MQVRAQEAKVIHFLIPRELLRLFMQLPLV